jgi:hypothetical protein
MIRYDVITKNGTYTKDGIEKTKWLKVGVCMDTKQNSLAIKLDSLPINFDGWLSLAEPKQKDNFNPKGNDEMPRSSPSDLDDQIPF